MSAFDHTKPFKTRDGQSVDLKISDGRGASKLWGYLGDRFILRGWMEDGRYSISGEHALDLVNIEPWTLPLPPEGMQWHRDDWTEDMLPGIKRPLLIGETGTYERLNDNGVWEDGFAPEVPAPYLDGGFYRTDRPLPSVPKKVPLTFEYVSKFVGVEFRLNESCVYGWRTISINGVDFPCVGLRSWSELMAYEWRSFQSPEWQPCEMEVKV
jgi:hypothetical protein